MGLIAHCDTTRVPYEIVKAVPTPPRTKTWGAIGHGDFIELLRDATTGRYDIVKEEYSMSKNGGKMFGTFLLDAGTPDGRRMVGFRNSIDKSLAAGLTAGRRVTVCDNLVFDGEFVDYQKHVGRLTLQVLKAAAEIAVESLEKRFNVFETWHDSLHTFKLAPRDAKLLTFRAMEQGVLPGGSFPKFHDLFFEKENVENRAEYDDTLHGFHGAITQLWNSNSLVTTGPRHTGLVKLIREASEKLELDGEL